MDESLKKIVEYAFSKCQFYRDYKRAFEYQRIKNIDEFEKIPILKKDVFRRENQPIISDDYINKPGMNIIKNHTSGTTGQYINSYWENSEFNASMLELWLLRREYGVKTSDRFCSFFTTLFVNNSLVRNSGNKYLSSDKRTLVFSNSNLYEEKLVKIYNDMLDFKPVWISIQPSILQMLINIKRKFKFRQIESLKYIELMGESFLPGFEEEVESEFGCIVRNMYGLIELNGVAYECKRNELYVLKSNVYVEILKDGMPALPGDVGEIVVTSLTNKMTPLIRYATGDYGYWKNSRKDILILKQGRVSEYVLLKDNETIPVYVLLAPVQIINSEVGNIIRDVRFVQKSYESVSAELYIDKKYKGWERTITEEYINNITDERLKKMHWDIKVLSNYRTHSGEKRKFFEIEMEENDEPIY